MIRTAITNFTDSDYNRLLASGKLPGRRNIFLFGKNPDVGTSESDFVKWGIYTFPSSPIPLYVSSSNVADVGLIYVVEVLDSNFDREIVIVLTNGQNAVQIVGAGGNTLWLRANLLFNITPDGTRSLGDVYVGTNPAPIGGVPAASETLAEAEVIAQQSNQAVYSVPRNADVLLHGLVITTNRGSSAGTTTDIYLRTREIDGGPFRRRTEVGIRTDGTSILQYNLALPVNLSGVVRRGVDLVVSAISSNQGTAVAGGFQIEIIDDEG